MMSSTAVLQHSTLKICLHKFGWTSINVATSVDFGLAKAFVCIYCQEIIQLFSYYQLQGFHSFLVFQKSLLEIFLSEIDIKSKKHREPEPVFTFSIKALYYGTRTNELLVQL